MHSSLPAQRSPIALLLYDHLGLCLLADSVFRLLLEITYVVLAFDRLN
jgi:hypothetical protein